MSFFVKLERVVFNKLGAEKKIIFFGLKKRLLQRT